MSASSSSAIVASYSDSLLVALKPNLTACSILSPVGEVNCTSMPDPYCLEAPSTQSVHQPFLSRHVLGCGISARKSAKTPLLRKSRLVLDAILAQFHCLAGHPSGQIRFMNCAPEWKFS